MDHVRRLSRKLPATYIYNPVVVPDAKHVNIDKDKLIFFSAPWKGLDMVLDMFEKVRLEQPSLRLYIACPSYVTRKTHRRLPANVINLGNLLHDEVISHVREALCCFYPADRCPETFGLVFAESNAVGTPVIAHPFGAAPELLSPEQLHNARDVTEIVDTLKRWRDGQRYPPELRAELSLERVVDRWRDVLFGNQG